MKGNYGKMMKQMQKMQDDMAKVQEELATELVEATAGGGAVKVKANGKQEIVSIEIEPSVVDPEDVEMLQDIVMAAANEALRQAGELAAKRMGGLTAQLGLPGLM